MHNAGKIRWDWGAIIIGLNITISGWGKNGYDQAGDSDHNILFFLYLFFFSKVRGPSYPPNNFLMIIMVDPWCFFFAICFFCCCCEFFCWCWPNFYRCLFCFSFFRSRKAIKWQLWHMKIRWRIFSKKLFSEIWHLRYINLESVFKLAASFAYHLQMTMKTLILVRLIYSKSWSSLWKDSGWCQLCLQTAVSQVSQNQHI